MTTMDISSLPSVAEVMRLSELEDDELYAQVGRVVQQERTVRGLVAEDETLTRGALADLGRRDIEEFVERYKENLHAAVCDIYREYMAGKLEKDVLVVAMTATVTALVTGSIWMLAATAIAAVLLRALMYTICPEEAPA